MMKCDMCYDRTSVGKRPMCATVCPSQALSFTTLEEIRQTRQGSPVNVWRFGNEVVRTKVFVMLPSEAPTIHIDVVGRRTAARAPESVRTDDVAALLEGV
jgi:Fe-S-cluster-containing dehydrogenase component